MPADRGRRVDRLGLCTAILVAAALYAGRGVLAPVAFALFVIALVWPVQRDWLGEADSAGLALAVTGLATLAVMVRAGAAATWGFGRSAVADRQCQPAAVALHDAAPNGWRALAWSRTGLISEHFDGRWLVGCCADAAGASCRAFSPSPAITLILTFSACSRSARPRATGWPRSAGTVRRHLSVLPGCLVRRSKLRPTWSCRTHEHADRSRGLGVRQRSVGLELAPNGA